MPATVAQRLDVQQEELIMIGDSWRDHKMSLQTGLPYLRFASHPPFYALDTPPWQGTRSWHEIARLLLEKETGRGQPVS